MSMSITEVHKNMLSERYVITKVIKMHFLDFQSFQTLFTSPRLHFDNTKKIPKNKKEKLQNLLV